MADDIKKLKKGSLSRRLAIGMAGARGGAGVLKSRATGLLLSKEKKQAHNEKALRQEAKRFVSELGKLKGAYVKIGQMMALYGEHMLPEVVTDALHELEDQTLPIRWQSIEKVLNDQLGDRLHELEIDETALAAASLAQVHRARLVADDQRQLCLKIQYPDIADAIDADFDSVIQMLLFTRWIKKSREFEDWAEELREMLHDEVDYLREVSMSESITQRLESNPIYIVPAVYPDLSTEKVIAMDFVEGVEVNHKDVARLSLARRNRLAEAMLDLFLREVFDWGIMQTDPNFGNYRIQIDQQGEEDRLVLLDFGAVRDYPDSFTEPLKQTITAAYHNDTAKVIEGLIGLGCLREQDTDYAKESFAALCVYILEPFRPRSDDTPDYAYNQQGEYCWKQSKLLKRAGKLVASSIVTPDFSLPSREFALLIRKLSGVFTFISTLEAEFNGQKVIERYLK